jgi:hypothetical protein
MRCDEDVDGDCVKSSPATLSVTAPDKRDFSASSAASARRQNICVVVAASCITIARVVCLHVAASGRPRHF